MYLILTHLSSTACNRFSMSDFWPGVVLEIALFTLVPPNPEETAAESLTENFFLLDAVPLKHRWTQTFVDSFEHSRPPKQRKSQPTQHIQKRPSVETPRQTRISLYQISFQICRDPSHRYAPENAVILLVEKMRTVGQSIYLLPTISRPFGTLITNSRKISCSLNCKSLSLFAFCFLKVS